PREVQGVAAGLPPRGLRGGHARVDLVVQQREADLAARLGAAALRGVGVDGDGVGAGDTVARGRDVRGATGGAVLAERTDLDRKRRTRGRLNDPVVDGEGLLEGLDGALGGRALRRARRGRGALVSAGVQLGDAPRRGLDGWWSEDGEGQRDRGNRREKNAPCP